MFTKISQLEDVLIDPYQPQKWGVYGIIWTAKTHYTHYLNHEPQEFPPDHFLFIGPDMLNNFTKQPESDAYLVIFNSIFFGRSTRDTYLLQTYPYFHDPSKIHSFKNEFSAGMALKGIFSEMLIKVKEEDDYAVYSDIMHKIIYLIMLFAQTRIQPHLKQDQPQSLDHDFNLAMRFRKEVSKNVHIENQVSYYADLLNISTRKLREITNQIFGKPPKDIILDFQTEKSMHLLSNTDIPIKEISFALGFSDPSNFSIFFKNRTDMTPHNFRKKYNKHRLFINDQIPDILQDRLN